MPTVRRARREFRFAWCRSAASQDKEQKAQTQPMARPALHLRPLPQNFQPDQSLRSPGSSRSFICRTLSGHEFAGRTAVIAHNPATMKPTTTRTMIQPKIRQRLLPLRPVTLPPFKYLAVSNHRRNTLNLKLTESLLSR